MDAEEILDQLGGLAESWKDDTAPEPHVSELDYFVEQWRKKLDERQPEPELIVMQVEITDDEEEIHVVHPSPHGEQYDQHQYLQDGDYVIVCGHKECIGDEFYEVDRSERWNPAVHDDRDQVQDDTQRFWVGPGPSDYEDRPNPLAGLPVLVTSEGSSGDGFSTDHFKCQSCSRRVTLPEWLETEWSS